MQERSRKWEISPAKTVQIISPWIRSTDVGQSTVSGTEYFGNWSAYIYNSIVVCRSADSGSVVPFPNWKWLWETAFTTIQKHSSSEVRVAIRIITAFIALNFSLSFLVGFLFSTTTTTFLASWWSWSFRRFRSRCFHWCHRRPHERHSRHIWLLCSKNGRSYYGDVSWNWRFGNLIGSHRGSQSLLFVLFGRINFEHELLELDILFYQSLLTRHLQVST